jgi:hypothetical protein
MATNVSLLTTGTNTHKETVEKFNLPLTYTFSDGILPQSGTIANATPDTGPFAVQEQGTPDMTVLVKSTGTPYAAALITGTPTSGLSQKMIVQLTADENVTIASNTSGSTKYDWVYIKLDPDKMENPAADSSDVATLVTSRSSSASTDNGTPPTYGLNIAVVTVANGASSITNANITDARAYSKVGNGGVNTASIDDSAVTTAKIADNSVTAAKTEELPKLIDIQNITTNTTTSDVLIQRGWNYKVGVASTTLEADTITFPVAYDSPPIVLCSTIGARLTSAGTPTSPAWFTASNPTIAAPSIITATNFKAYMRDIGNFSTSYNYGYAWIAIGVKAR